ncbi:MAG: DUF3164 family protein [Bacteroidetes bacterium]|nr:DUF3164 family protein [Bacteroidota bacterium]
MNTQVLIQTIKQQAWTDASGAVVPLKFVPELDKKKETLAAKVHKHALAAEKNLNELHALMHNATEEIKRMVKQEFELKEQKGRGKGKGSITWYNFDKSIKIEADMNDVVKWDEAMMTEALQLLNKYLDKSLGEEKQLIKELVASAFSNSKGCIDTSKIFQLLKYENKMKSIIYTKACELMRNAQGIDKTKLYMRVWEKMEDGSYRNVNLNFSSL